LITLTDGSQIPVQNLKVGNQMLGYDTATGNFRVSLVKTIVTVTTYDMLVIHTRYGAPYRTDANPHQTLWVKTSEGSVSWLPVTEIRVGDYLFTPDGWVIVTSIDFIPMGNYTMYDIIASIPYFANGYLDPVRKL
jgi:hypothetical protein